MYKSGTAHMQRVTVYIVCVCIWICSIAFLLLAGGYTRKSWPDRQYYLVANGMPFTVMGHNKTHKFSSRFEAERFSRSVKNKTVFAIQYNGQWILYSGRKGEMTLNASPDPLGLPTLATADFTANYQNETATIEIINNAKIKRSALQKQHTVNILPCQHFADDKMLIKYLRTFHPNTTKVIVFGGDFCPVWWYMILKHNRPRSLISTDDINVPQGMRVALYIP